MLTASLDFSEFHKKVELSRAALRRDLALATRRTADVGVAAAKTGRFKDRTGNLRGTITTRTIGWSGDTFWMGVHAPMPYAHFVDFPTRPHPIHGNPFLHFFWEKRGVWFTGRSVNHPGTKGTYFFAGAIVVMLNTLQDELAKGFANLRSVWS